MWKSTLCSATWSGSNSGVLDESCVWCQHNRIPDSSPIVMIASHYTLAYMPVNYSSLCFHLKRIFARNISYCTAGCSCSSGDGGGCTAERLSCQEALSSGSLGPCGCHCCCCCDLLLPAHPIWWPNQIQKILRSMQKMPIGPKQKRHITKTKNHSANVVVVAYTWAGLKQCVVVPPVCCECQPESHGWEHMIPATSSPGIGTHPASSWQTWNPISNHKSTVSLQLWLAFYTKSLAAWSAEKLTWHS